MERFSSTIGVDMYLGSAKFISNDSIRVNDKDIKFLKCCIATGGKPWVPEGILGLNLVPHHTSESIFNLTR